MNSILRICALLLLYVISQSTKVLIVKINFTPNTSKKKKKHFIFKPTILSGLRVYVNESSEI